MKASSKIEVFSQNNCSGCVQVKNLLQSKNIPFIEYNLSTQPMSKQLLLNRVPGVRTVPQVFINNILIGGLKELQEELKKVDYS
jgi:glutaredoxin 3